MDKYLIAFQDFIRSDKTYVEELGTRYHHEIVQVIQLLEEHRPYFFVNHCPSLEELIDFLDGNGFHIDTTSDLAKNWRRVNPRIAILVPEYIRECVICGHKGTITLEIHLEDVTEEKYDVYSTSQPYDEWEPTQNPLGSRVQNIQITLEVGTADARPPP
jgi:hypothetical protein